MAAFPFLARLAAGGNEEELTRTTGRAARNTVFVAAAAMAALVVLARPLVSVLYQHGEFSRGGWRARGPPARSLRILHSRPGASTRSSPATSMRSG